MLAVDRIPQKGDIVTLSDDEELYTVGRSGHWYQFGYDNEDHPEGWYFYLVLIDPTYPNKIARVVPNVELWNGELIFGRQQPRGIRKPAAVAYLGILTDDFTPVQMQLFAAVTS